MTEVLENDASIRVVTTVPGQVEYDFDFLAYTLGSVFAVHTSLADVETVLVAGTDFTVAGLGVSTGGTIDITLSGLVTEVGDEVLIYRSVPIERPADYAIELRAAVLNRELDLSVMVQQELRRDIDRALKVPLGAPGILIETGAAGSVPVFDADGNLLDQIEGSAISGAQANADAAAQDADDAEAARIAAEAAAATLTFADQPAAEAGLVDNRIMSPEGASQFYAVRKATDPELDAGVEDTKYVTSRGAERTADRRAVIHRNYYDLYRDFGADPDNLAVDHRAILQTAFTAIAAAGVGGKRKLYLPKGVYRMDYNTLVSLTPPQGLEIFGDGPDETILEVVNTTVVGTRTVFQITNSDVTFDKSITVRTSAALSAVGATWLLFSLGGASNFVLHSGIEGGVGFLNAAPDNTLTHIVHVIQRQDSLFEGIHVDFGHWNSISRGYLNDHLQLNAITRRVRWGSKFRASNMYREFIAINAPSVESSDWIFEGGRTENNWDRSIVASHLAIGNGKNVKIDGWHFEGAGAAVHVEEDAWGFAVVNCSAVLSSTGAKFLRLFSNNVGGVNNSPKGGRVANNHARAAVSATAGSRGIEWGNTGFGPPSIAMTVTGNIMERFERGYSMDVSPEGTQLVGNVGRLCTTGGRINTGLSAAAKAGWKSNHMEACGTAYVDVGGGAVPWGTNNTSA